MGRHNMAKKILNRILAVMVVISMLMSSTITALADETSEYIAALQQRENETQQTITNLEKETKETQDAINSLQGQKEQTENNVNALQSESNKLQSTINGYNNQLEDINAEIGEAEAALALVSAEIVRLNEELNDARRREAEQYALLKKQIQSTYESGGTDGMLMLLLTSGSIQDFLTKTEYVSALVSYDQKKLKEYRDLEAEIEAKTALVEEKQNELDAYQASLDENYDELAELTDTVMGNLNKTNSSISSEKNKLADYNNQLASLDAKMKSLESQVAAAQAALAQQIAERQAAMIAAGQTENLGGSYAATATELEWLAATIQAEADGESYTGKLAVGSVIMNRVKSSSFPNSIVGVITQNLQFASYRSGKVELIISRGPNSTCLQAAQEVLNGARVGDYLFFMTKYYADYYGIAEYTMIGNHAFFYRWIVNKPVVEETPQPEPQPEAPPEPQPEEQQPEQQDNPENYDDGGGDQGDGGGE